MINLTDEDLADRWKTSKKTLYRLRTQNRGPKYLKISKKILYPLTAVEEYEKQLIDGPGFTSTPEQTPHTSHGLIHLAALIIH